MSSIGTKTEAGATSNGSLSTEPDSLSASAALSSESPAEDLSALFSQLKIIDPDKSSYISTLLAEGISHRDILQIGLEDNCQLLIALKFKPVHNLCILKHFGLLQKVCVYSCLEIKPLLCIYRQRNTNDDATSAAPAPAQH